MFAELTAENWSIPPLPSNTSVVSSEVSAVVPVITQTSLPEPPYRESDCVELELFG